MRDHYNIQLAALEDFDLAVARIDRCHRFTFLNPRARTLFGVGNGQELTLQELFRSEREFEIVRRRLKERWEGKSSAYEMNILPLNCGPDDPDIPVSIFAFPDASEDGEILGSLVIARDLREERIREEIYAAMECTEGNGPFLATVASQIRRIIPFDELRIVTFSQGCTHVRTLFSTDLDLRRKYPHRWWQMPAFMRVSLARKVCGVVNIDDLRDDPEYAAYANCDASLRKYFDSPVRQAVNIPIRQGGAIVAFFSLESNTDDRYTQETVDLLERLPIQEVVRAAIHREESGQQRMMLDLIRKVGAKTNDVLQLADALVKGLCRSYGWNHVSIFQRDPGANSLKLLCQANHLHAALPPGAIITSGLETDSLLDLALRSQHIEDGTSDLRHTPFDAIGEKLPQGSALAVPILGRKADWVLYIETADLNAFATEEKELLELLASEAGEVLHRSALFELQASVLGAINDAVIETNEDGSISWCNDAAEFMFGLPAKPTERIMLEELIAKGKDRLPNTDFYHEEVELRRWRGGESHFPGILSASALPAHLGGKVYVASNFSFQNQVFRFEQFETVFQQAALESRTPLALASTWLSQWAEERRVDRETIGKILSQLARADLPLERLIRLGAELNPESPNQKADLNTAIHGAVNILPQSLREHIDIVLDDGRLEVSLCASDLQFCIESIIAFAMRTRPQSKTLRVRTARNTGNIILLATGDWVPDLDQAGETALERWKNKLLCDLTLGESTIAGLVQKAHGQYHREFSPGFSIELTFPLHH